MGPTPWYSQPTMSPCRPGPPTRRPRTNCFGTTGSLPVVPHPASRRRSYLQLHGAMPAPYSVFHRLVVSVSCSHVGPVPSPGGLGSESAMSAVPDRCGDRSLPRRSSGDTWGLATGSSHQTDRLNSLKAAASWAEDMDLRRAAISALARTSQRSLSGCPAWPLSQRHSIW